MNVPSRILAMIVAVLAGAALAAAQTNVVMKPGAAARAGEPVRITDVAALDGPEAERLSPVVVLEKASGGDGGIATVTASQVKAAAERAVPGLNWGRVTISGGACFVRVSAGPAPPAEPARTTREIEPPAPVDAAAGTIRAEITHRLASLYGVGPTDLRIGFSGLASSDVGFLGRALEPDGRYEVQPSASSRSGRVPLRVDVYQRDRLVETRTFNADVLVRRAVVVASATIDRETVITPEAVTTEERWLAPDASAGLAAAQVIGSTARRRVEAGRVVGAADVQTPVVVRKGEMVWVHCLSGSVVVKVRAKALAEGRDGQDVPMQLEGSRKTFTARMSGRGTAVMLLEDQDAGSDRADGPARDAPAEARRSRSPARGAGR
ncbi:MAG: flagellar basal body P-ring formation protein FlgA [Phycisphaerae bacterium]|nr:flagellar basal body P-ring formation protein FlgA [Phycisphaerae bacterium]